MRRPAGFLCALLTVASLQGAAQLQTYLMTKPEPSASCTVLSASPPPAYTTFSATETEAYLWFYVTGVSAGDIFASEYYNPSGTFYAPPSGAWNPASSAGNYCYTDTAFKIAGQVPATTPGLWTVKVKLNGASLFTLTFTVTAAGAANPSLLNGGFEQPGTGNLWDIPVGSTHITGWNVTKGAVDYVNGLATCSEGKACIDLDGNTAGGISQTIQTTLGTTYTVSFDLAGNVDGGAKVKQLRVLAAGQSQDFSFDTTGRTFSNLGWTPKSWSFNANAASATLEFSSLGPAGSWYGPFIDNVRVTTGGAGGGGGIAVGGLPPGTAMIVDARANIFAANRTSAFSGQLPKFYAVNNFPAGSALTFSNPSGATSCMQADFAGPDGSKYCAGGNTNINSYQGIAGIIHSKKSMFLVGLFLGETTPQEPAPARLDFSNNENFTSLSPLLGQVFFVGDGLTGTGVGTKQAFVVPQGATRLHLGVADAYGFQGAPSAYDDNLGSWNITLDSSAGGGGQPVTPSLAVSGSHNIFGAGHTTPPAPSGQGAGSLPPVYWIDPAAGRALRFTSVTGTLTDASVSYGPDGITSFGCDVQSYGGISGIVHRGRALYLTGVFLDNAEPKDPAPARLDFTSNDNYATLSPLIGQTFFIGDGLTGTGSGARQEITIPPTATRLFLGIADAAGCNNTPGGYSNNGGSVTATFEIVTASGGGGGGGATGTNLVRNWGAEEGSASNDCSGVASIPGWTTAGQVAVCKYSQGGGYPIASSPGPTDRGNNFFGGGYAAASFITQVVDLSSSASQIDAGSTPYTLSGWLGGYESQGDNAKLIAAFKNASGVSVGTAQIGPVTPAERNSVTGMVSKSTSGTVPVGTRSAELRLEFNRAEGSSNDGYADSLSFSLSGAGGGAGGGTTPGCSYNVPPTSTISGAGGTGIVLVTTAANCAWTATSNAAWLTIIAGASGTGNGAVNYRATANPSTTASRTGTLTIAGQTHTVTQGAGTPACTYSISSTSANAPHTGTTAAVLVSAGTGCAWTATSNAAWITIKSGSSGAGNGTVNYQVAANTATTSRTGTLTIAGQTFTLTQAGAPAADTPSITEGGVVNAASYIPATLPAGAIGQGSFFSVFGNKLGSAQYAQATSFPLPTVLGEVSLKVTKGTASVDAYPVFVSENQINAILPSNAPVGDAQLTVTYKGKTSAPMPMKVAVNNFGIFSTAGGRGPGIIQNYVSPTDQPLNTRSTPAKPNQVEIMWGTGLGPITAPDNLAPPAGDLPFAVEIYVGNKLAKKLYSGRAPCCSGVDQIVFEVPPDAPTGCYVPVQVKVASTYSNIVTMAISADGGSCTSPLNPFSEITGAGGKSGSIVLVRGNVLAQVQADQAPLDLTLDLGLGLFQQSQAVGDLGYNPLLSMPPVGTCTASSGNLDLGALLGTGLGGEVPGQEGVLGRELDAGKELTVTGPKGNSIPLPKLNAEENKGPYAGLLGGSIPLEGAQSLPLFLDGGRYTVSGPGGKDVGPFKATLDIPTPLQWTNRNQITSIDRSASLTLTWSGGDPGQQMVLIAGGSSDQKSKASGGFICFVPAAGGSYTVPPSVLGNLPPSVADKPEDSIGALLFGTIPAGNYAKFTATGLDAGYVFYSSLNAKTVPYK